MISDTVARFHVGREVRVVAAYDDTLPKRFIGLKGRVVSTPNYQGVGDDPDEDPFLEVEHRFKNGRYERMFYWLDEIEIVD
jgi:hypothetical protein